MPSFEGIWTLVRNFARNLLRRDRVERDLTDELDGYADLLIEEKVAQVMSRDDARTQGSRRSRCPRAGL